MPCNPAVGPANTARYRPASQFCNALFSAAGTLAAAGVVHAAEAPPLAQTDTPSPSPEPERPAETPAVAEDAAEAPAPAVSEAEPYAAPRFQEKIDLDAIQLEPFYEKLAAKAAPEQTPLTLEECIRRALKSNLDIQIVSFGALKSSADILAAKGEFDPIGTGNLTYTETEQQASSQIFAYGGVSSIEDYRARGQAGIQGKLHWGTQYDVSMLVEWEENTFNYFIKEWSGGLSLSLTQPLLRGRGKAVNLARVRIARNSEEAAEHQLRIQTMSSLAEVIKAYWDLVGAVEPVSYTHLRAHETVLDLVCRLLLEKKNQQINTQHSSTITITMRPHDQSQLTY